MTGVKESNTYSRENTGFFRLEKASIETETRKQDVCSREKTSLKAGQVLKNFKLTIFDSQEKMLKKF